MLKQLSALFGVSINTLLGSTRQVFCQCCGMPLTDDIMARDPSGRINEDYCRWCLVDGNAVYHTLEDMVDFLVSGHFIPGVTDEEARAIYLEQLPKLKHWQTQGGQEP